MLGYLSSEVFNIVFPKMNVCLNIPFTSPESAALACKVLSVDKEIKGSSVQKELSTNDTYLVVKLHGEDLKRLRVAVSAFIKNVLLIVKTLNQFS